jgi:predicted nucleotidyltransferase
MNKEYVNQKTIFEAIVGSRLYGINTPDSDYDKTGVMIPDKSYFYGFKKFEQFQGYDTDKIIYDIRKAIKLISDNNPNMLDLISIPDRCIIKMTPYWQKVIDNKDLFISKRCRYTYSGYAISQLKRINVHRKFLNNPILNKPKRKDYGLDDHSIFPTTQIKSILYSVIDIIDIDKRHDFLDKLDGMYRNYISPLLLEYVNKHEHQLSMEWLHAGVKSQAKTIANMKGYIKDEYREIAEKEVKYYNDMKEWKQYQEWQRSRNKDRAKLEKKFGFDTKHSGHLVRLLRMGKEILTTGQINNDRTDIDAEELKEIRNGSWSYEKIEEYANNMDKELEELYKKSTLQKSPKMKKIEELCIDIVEKYLSNEKHKCRCGKCDGTGIDIEDYYKE